MNAIVSICRDWGIGYHGRLLVKNKADMKYFVEHTTGGVVIMGRATLLGFPHQAPLKNRRNIVLSHDEHLVIDGAEVVHSAEEALDAVSDVDPDKVWVIGGQSAYKQLLPYCTRAYVTKNDVAYPADAFFPDLDAHPDWKVEKREDGGVTEDGVRFEFVTYKHV